ncbi:MAG: ABC transporter permease subunit [Actinomycetota bacterium]
MRSTSSVLSKTLYDRRRALIGWSLGFIIFTLMTMAIYPSIRETRELDQLVDRLPEAIRNLVGDRSLTSPIGFVQSRLFQLLVPLLLLVYGVGQGADAIAGEEQRKTMDLLLSNPVARRRVVLEKAAAVLVEMAAIGWVLFVALVAFAEMFGVDLSIEGMAAAVTNAFLFALAYTAFGLALGAATGSRAVAVGVTTALAALSYLIDSLAALVEGMDRIAWLSPFHHYIETEGLAFGFDLAYALGSTIAIAILVVAAVVAFERRDVRS